MSVKSRAYRGRASGLAAATAQWAESKALRDAAVAVARRGAMIAGPNSAQRGLSLGPGELKAVDTSVNQAADSTGGVVLLSGIARGDDINQRTGREVTLRSIECRFTARVTAGTGIDQQQRLLIVYDRQSNGAAPSVADVLGSANVLYPRNLENRRRFKVLYDRFFQLNGSGEAGSEKVFKFYRRLRHPMVFNSGNAGTVADITSGSVYAVICGSVAAGATAGNINGRVRLRYEDK